MTLPDDKPPVADSLTGAKAAAAEQFSLKDAIGGPRGAVESVLPTLVFTLIFGITRNLMWAIYGSVGIATAAVLLRVVSRSNVSPAIAGFIGVVISAVLAWRSGDARDFALSGLLVNFAYLGVYLVSVLPTPAIPAIKVPRGPWPIMGLVLGPLLGEGLRWKHFAPRARAFWLATWPWIGLFALRLAVELPLYFLHLVDALMVAKLVLGVPAYAGVAFLTWLIIRRVPKTPDPTDETGAPHGPVSPG